MYRIYPKGYMHPDVHYSIIYGGQEMEITKVSFNRFLDEEDVMIDCIDILTAKLTYLFNRKI